MQKPSGEVMTFNNIVVALVGGKDEIPLIDEAVKYAISFSSKLTVVHVNPPHAGEISMMMESTGKKLNEEDIRNLFIECGHGEIAAVMEVKIVSGEPIHSEIARLAEGADLLILGHRRMNTFKEMFFDSIDEGIVNRVNCPVLVVPKN